MEDHAALAEPAQSGPLCEVSFPERRRIDGRTEAGAQLRFGEGTEGPEAEPDLVVVVVALRVVADDRVGGAGQGVGHREHHHRAGPRLDQASIFADGGMLLHPAHLALHAGLQPGVEHGAPRRRRRPHKAGPRKAELGGPVAEFFANGAWQGRVHRAAAWRDLRCPVKQNNLHARTTMRNLRLLFAALAATLMLSACAARASYDTDNISDPPDPSRFEVNGPATDRLDAPRGKASWYGAALHGNTTASGEPFNMYDFTAAHKTLPFGTWVMVTRTDTKAWTIVRINDRGPFVAGRIIDLSWGAANEVGMVSDGVAPVQLEILRQR